VAAAAQAVEEQLQQSTATATQLTQRVKEVSSAISVHVTLFYSARE
jgi:hypothetical protein